MHTADAGWLARLLGVAAPWVISDVQVSQRTRVVMVRVEQPPPRSGLFGRRTVAAPRRQCAWDHVGIAGWRCRVQLVLRDGQDVPQAGWCGDADQGWTRGLQRQVMDLLLAGATVEQLAVLTGLPFAELWKWKFRLDQGAPRSSQAAARPAPVAAAASTAPAAADVGVPPEASHVWPALLHQRLALDVRTLGLRLLLAKVQREAAAHGDADLHRQAAQDLHRYFVRHAAVLQHELAQLARQAPPPALAPIAPMAPMAQTDGPVTVFQLPDASDPLWLALLEGQRELDVRVLGLRLLLSKLRTQIRRIDDDEVRMVKLVELHRYFARHQATLGHEIDQIRAWHPH